MKFSTLQSLVQIWKLPLLSPVGLLATILEVFNLGRWCKRLQLLSQPTQELMGGQSFLLSPLFSTCALLPFFHSLGCVGLLQVKLGKGWEVRGMDICSSWPMLSCHHWHRGGTLVEILEPSPALSLLKSTLIMVNRFFRQVTSYSSLCH